MSDQVKAAYPSNEPPVTIGNNAYASQRGLDADARHRDNHEYTGDSPANQGALSSGSGTRTPERLKRELAVLFARVSVGLEGFVPSKRAEMQAQRFIEGKITLSEFVDANDTYNCMT